MPYKTDWEPRGIVWEFYGDVTAQEIEKANAEFYSDERSDRSEYQIIDATKVSCVEWKERDIKVMAAYDSGAERVIKNVRVAFVTHDEEIASKIEKYVEVSRRLNSSWQFSKFHTISKARAWVTSDSMPKIASDRQDLRS